MSACFHVQNQHADTFLAPAVDMLIIPAAPQPPKYHDHQWIGSQFNCHNAGTVSAAPQRPKCQKHQRMDRHLFAVCRKRSHAVVQLPLPEFLNHIGSAQTEVFGRPAAAALHSCSKKRIRVQSVSNANCRRFSVNAITLFRFFFGKSHSCSQLFKHKEIDSTV